MSPGGNFKAIVNKANEIDLDTSGTNFEAATAAIEKASGGRKQTLFIVLTDGCFNQRPSADVTRYMRRQSKGLVWILAGAPIDMDKCAVADVRGARGRKAWINNSVIVVK
jgi:hypothetical protein